jgi:2-dehydropantoate 2-reductase
MTIIVFGGGAIGSVYAAHLARHHDVTLIARQPHVDAVNRSGLQIGGRADLVAHIRASTKVDTIPPGAVVLLTTKVNGNRDAAMSIRNQVREDTTILCVQNGLGGDEIVRSAIGGRAAVLRGVTQFGAIFVGPGVIDLKVIGHTLIEAHERSAAIAEALTLSGLDGRVSADITTEVWRKLIFNCVINPITAMIGSEVGAIADRHLDPLKQLVIDECVAVARAEGVSFETDFQQALRDVFGPSRNVASMRQDLLHRRPTEIAHMNGAIVARGRAHGIPCPVNAALVAIIQAMEQ